MYAVGHVALGYLTGKLAGKALKQEIHIPMIWAQDESNGVSAEDITRGAGAVVKHLHIVVGPLGEMVNTDVDPIATVVVLIMPGRIG